MLALTLLAMLSWVVSSLAHRRAVSDARNEAIREAAGQARAMRSDLQKFRLLPLVLSEFPDVGQALSTGDPAARARLNAKLELLAARTGVPYIYIVDTKGETLAASNAKLSTSFVGRNYRFRPYFSQTMRDGATEYFALGNVTGRVGLFLARRIEREGRAVGIVVVKVEFDTVAASWRAEDANTMIVDPEGIILIASDPKLKFRTLTSLSQTRRAEISRTQQFGNVRLLPARYNIGGKNRETGSDGQEIAAAIENLPILGWRLIHTEPVAPALAAARARIALWALLVVVALVTLFAAILYPIVRARRALAAEASLKAEVARRTIQLDQANDNLREEISQRIRANERFRAAREELAQANRLGSLGAITAGVAHEINQPVAAIRTLAANCTKLLDRGYIDRVAKHLETITGLTARVGTIIGELRGYSRRGHRPIQAVALQDVIDGTMLLIGERIRQAAVTFDRPAIDDDIPAVHAERVRLEQVLVNLLQNALDAVADTPNPRIALTIEVCPSWVDLLVEDSGAGIDKAIANQIFEPFTTGKRHGLGLGLGIARDIMAEFEGSLTVTEPALGGAAFRVRLLRHDYRLGTP